MDDLSDEALDRVDEALPPVRLVASKNARTHAVAAVDASYQVWAHLHLGRDDTAELDRHVNR